MSDSHLHGDSIVTQNSTWASFCNKGTFITQQICRLSGIIICLLSYPCVVSQQSGLESIAFMFLSGMNSSCREANWALSSRSLGFNPAVNVSLVSLFWQQQLKKSPMCIILLHSWCGNSVMSMLACVNLLFVAFPLLPLVFLKLFWAGSLDPYVNTGCTQIWLAESLSGSNFLQLPDWNCI